MTDLYLAHQFFMSYCARLHGISQDVATHQFQSIIILDRGVQWRDSSGFGLKQRGRRGSRLACCTIGISHQWLVNVMFCSKTIGRCTPHMLFMYSWTCQSMDKCWIHKIPKIRSISDQCYFIYWSVPFPIVITPPWHACWRARVTCTPNLGL